VRVFDAEPDLAGLFEEAARGAVRDTATTYVLHASPGRACDVASWEIAVSRGIRLLIIDGLVACHTDVGDRAAVELLGVGDLVQVPEPRPDDLLERRESWRALLPTRFAVLDEAFLERVQPWPQFMYEMLRRSDRRTADANALRAITAQPRLDIRLVLLLWLLASRWGRVGPTGIRLTLPLTHQMLGQLVAAERPSISRALARLAHARLVTGHTNDLHLHGTPQHHLNTLRHRQTDIKHEPRRPRRNAIAITNNATSRAGVAPAGPLVSPNRPAHAPR
jgi:CRP-like cAMP-binding protein